MTSGVPLSGWVEEGVEALRPAFSRKEQPT